MGYGSSLGPHLGEKKNRVIRARSVGSSYRGSQEWLLFKVSGFFSIPLSIYIFISILLGQASSYDSLVIWISNPINAGILIFTIIMMSMHSVLGAIGVLDDYIHNKVLNFFGGMFLRFFFILVNIICIVSILVIMVKNM